MAQRYSGMIISAVIAIVSSHLFMLLHLMGCYGLQGPSPG
jgi:hypothetical protein